MKEKIEKEIRFQKVVLAMAKQDLEKGGLSNGMIIQKHVEIITCDAIIDLLTKLLTEEKDFKTTLN
jgi:hypothetical protein